MKQLKRMQGHKPDEPRDTSGHGSEAQISLAQKRENLYKAIERTQAFMHKRVSPDDVMKNIRRRYPAPLFFIEANHRTLEQTGLSRTDAFYYSMIPDLTRTVMSQQWGTKPRLTSAAGMMKYLKTLYIGVHVECFYLILLDGRGQLIRPVLLQRGDVDHAAFYLGQLLSMTLQEQARYILLAHNHPGGTRYPSREDLICTLRTLNAFASLNIPLLDHMIVTGNEVISIRQAGLLPDMLWNAALPGNSIVRNWFAGSESE